MANELTTTNYQLPSVGANIAEAFAEEMEGLEGFVSFAKVKVPSGGSVAWEVPGNDPDSPDMVKELIGVIVDHHPVNAYWENKFDGANSAPQCMSNDGKVGVGTPGGNCKTCQNNQFGSAGAGKACKNMHRVYLLRSGEALPLQITLPPTGIKPLGDYLGNRLVVRGLRSYGVITKITLKKETSAQGITYAAPVFSVEKVLTSEEIVVMAEYSKGIKGKTRSFTAQVQTEEPPF